MSAQNPKQLRRAMKTWQVAPSVRDGKAKPEDAKWLMRHFCALVSRKHQIPERLLIHFRDAFQKYLSGKKTIEAALGLTKGKRGRRNADESRQIEMAAKVLELHIAKPGRKRAVKDAAAHFNVGLTTIKDALARHMTDAYINLTRRRNLKRNPLTLEEKKRITEISDGKISWDGLQNSWFWGKKIHRIGRRIRRITRPETM